MEDKIILDKKYLIKSLIGKGYSSNVYCVEDMESKKIYAAKIFRDLKSKYFENEIEILTFLKKKNITNIVNIIDSGEGEINLKSQILKKVDSICLSSKVKYFGPNKTRVN